MKGRYILDENDNPVEESDLMKWAKQMNDREKHTAGRTEIDGATVSTVFLGLDHRFGEGEPILWETMVFGGKHDQYQERCGGLRADAISMHERVVAMVRKP